MRADGRDPAAIRPVRFETGFNIHTAGSCVFEMGRTRVHCTASIEESIPRWLRGSGKGWVTAEYRMLPGATSSRFRREDRGVKGRTAEIQRLIGRALRAVVDMRALGEQQITVDCDVLQADGGTRTAAVNGGFIALAMALQSLKARGLIQGQVLRDHVAAVSLGVVGDTVMADLAYQEDFNAVVDLNLVMSGAGDLIEIQGTGEERPFTRAELDRILALGGPACAAIVATQRRALGGAALP